MTPALFALLLSPPILYPAVFVFGTFFGSFFNVIVYRAGQENQTWLKGVSCCENCGQPIAWFDNIPLISYLFLRGKSRCCGSKIAIIHPLVEFATGLVFLFSVYLALNRFGLEIIPSLGMALIGNSVLWLIVLFDLKYMIIPDELVIILTMLAVLKQFLQSVYGEAHLIASLAVSLAFLGLFLFLWVITKRKGIGFGDIKLIAPLTLFVGYPQSIVGVFCAFIIGALWGIILLLIGKKKFGQVLPFGPFLIAGAWIAMVWGEQIWQAYWRLI